MRYVACTHHDTRHLLTYIRLIFDGLMLPGPTHGCHCVNGTWTNMMSIVTDPDMTGQYALLLCKLSLLFGIPLYDDFKKSMF